METKTFGQTTYTVNDKRRGWKNDRTIYQVTGPKGGAYSLVEFDSGSLVLTDIANGRSRREHPSAPSTPYMIPQHRAEYEHERYGWDATQTDVDRHTAEFIVALERWQSRDRENHEETYSAASALRGAMQNLSADCAQLARLANFIWTPQQLAAMR